MARDALVIVGAAALLLVALEAALRLGGGISGFGAPPDDGSRATVRAGAERGASDAAPCASRPAEERMRVAVLGSSAAAGYTSSLAFASVVESALREAFPGRCVYVRSFAEEGARFHADQADLARAILPYFDVLLIYAGNNEVANAIYEQGRADVYGLNGIPDARTGHEEKVAAVVAELARSSEPHAGPVPDLRQTDLRLVELTRAALNELERLVARVRGALLPQAAPGRSAAPSFRPAPPPRTSDRKVVPDRAIAALPESYAADLAEIARLAEQQGKVVVVSTVFSFDTWPPMFSRRRAGLTRAEQRRFDRALDRGETAYERGRLALARAQLDGALRIDPRHAEASYLRGMVAFTARDFPDAWRHLSRARDEDGFPIRTLGAVNARVAGFRDRPRGERGAGGLYVADAEALVRDAVERGMSFEELMNDPQHPNALGHLLIGRALLCTLSRVPGFDQPTLGEACSVLDPPRLRSLAGEHDHAPSTAADGALEGARTRIHWLMRMRRFAARPAKFLAMAERAWREVRARDDEREPSGEERLLAALALESRDARVARLKEVARLHPDLIEDALEDGLRVGAAGGAAGADGEASDPLIVLSREDLRQVLAAEGVRIERDGRPPAAGRSGWTVRHH